MDLPTVDEWKDVLSEFSEIWLAIVFVVILIAFTYVIKTVRNIMTPFDDDEEVEERSNLAVGLRRAGLYVGLGIAVVGAVTGVQAEAEGRALDAAIGSIAGIPLVVDELSLAEEVGRVALNGAIAVGLLILVGFFNDRIILRGIDNNDEVRKGNVAVGLVEGGGYIAAGLVLVGAFTGEGGGIASAVAFTFLGQITLFVMYAVYQWITPFDVTAEIKGANPAAGIAVGGMLVALGAILRASIAGPFEGWLIDLATFGFYAVVSIFLLLILRQVTDRLFLPNTDLATEIVRDRNSAAISLAYGAIIAVALVVSFSI